MKLVWKLLRENINKPQLIGFFFANLIGMVILLLSFQLYNDIASAFDEEDNLFKKDYFTITKKVGFLSNLSEKSTTFSESEIEALKKQPFIKDVGVFTPAQFSVLASINFSKQARFDTQMFFESIPNKFVDIESAKWNFDPAENIIPILLPKSYIDIYNFGFADANSLPKIPESLIQMISLNVTIIGHNNEVRRLKGYVIGFSNRINTILVPENFMKWANKEVSETESVSARLMIEVDNIADPDLSVYLEKNGYELDSGNTTASKISFFLKIIVSVVAVVGIIICILSFSILVLSIFLLLEKNMHTFKTLRLIGYSKSYLVRPYELLSVLLTFLNLFFSIGIVWIARSKYIESLSEVIAVDKSASVLPMVLLGFILCILLSCLNVLIIRKRVL